MPALQLQLLNLCFLVSNWEFGKNLWGGDTIRLILTRFDPPRISKEFNRKAKETGCHSDACQCNKATGWDNIIGFKAWEYVSRFQQVSDLVKRDLELRGFAVDKIEVYTHKCNLKNCRGGVFVKWDVRFHGETKETQ